jgi:hypothetical protein
MRNESYSSDTKFDTHNNQIQYNIYKTIKTIKISQWLKPDSSIRSSIEIEKSLRKRQKLRDLVAYTDPLTRPALLGFLKNDGMEIAKNSSKKCYPVCCKCKKKSSWVAISNCDVVLRIEIFSGKFLNSYLRRKLKKKKKTRSRSGLVKMFG